MTKFYNICVKRAFKNREGKDITQWPQVGTMRVMDDGKQFIDLPLLGQSLYVFEQQAKNEAHTKAKAAEKDPWDDDLPA